MRSYLYVISLNYGGKKREKKKRRRRKVKETRATVHIEIPLSGYTSKKASLHASSSFLSVGQYFKVTDNFCLSKCHVKQRLKVLFLN